MIAATNRNLEEEVRQGRFREDLFYRLNVLPIVLPPLRERPRTSRRSCDFYHRRVSTASSRSACAASTPAAMAQLQRYGWPGNVRELRNAIERAMLLADGDDARRATTFPALARGALRRAIASSCRRRASISSSSSGRSSMQALERSGWNQTQAAALLGLNRDQIRYRIEKFQLGKTI